MASDTCLASLACLFLIPKEEQTIVVNFWSGILASDFAGFNLYISTTQTFTNALLNSSGGYPTIPFSTHARSNITLQFPTTLTYNNGTLYYVSVTAYGTNDLAEGGKIETRRDSVIAVVPRGETQGNGGFAIDTQAQTVSAPNNGVIQSYGQQTDRETVAILFALIELRK